MPRLPGLTLLSRRCLFVVLPLLAACPTSTTTGDPTPPVVEQPAPRDALAGELDRLRQVATSVDQVRFDRGFPSVVVARVPVQGATVVEKARDYLDQFKQLYGLDETMELGVRRYSPEDSRSFVAFHQRVAGVPVYGAALNVYVRGDDVTAALGRLLTQDAKVDTRPRLNANQAVARARTLTGLADAVVLGPPTLVVFDPALLNPHAVSAPTLAWRLVLGDSLILLSAITGALLSQNTQQRSAEDPAMAYSVCGWKQISSNSYKCETGATEAGLTQTGQSDLQVVSLSNYTRLTWQWWFDTFEHSGPDGEGVKDCPVYVHEEVLDPDGDPNAWVEWGEIHFWDEFVALDVMAHEWTHRVIGNTSGLCYQNECGAMNEGFADLFGNLVQGNEYEVAEYSTHGIIRDMAQPSRFDDPDRYSLYRTDITWDNGGVHTNSGIFNRVHYLMLEGGTQAGVTVPKMDRNRVIWLAYFALWELPWSSNYAMARAYYETRAQQWVDEDVLGFTAQDVCAVKNAFAAVEIGSTSTDLDCDGTPNGGDTDDDNDGVKDTQDNCPGVKNPSQVDSDGDGQGNLCDEDADNDGVLNGYDNCIKPNANQADTNEDGVGDACQDADGDGVLDFVDNCPGDANPNQLDSNNNGEGDACDPDHDGDGKFGLDDNCPFTSNADQADEDGDGLGTACDGCPMDNQPATAWTTGIPELGIVPQPWEPDADQDGIPDVCDPSPHAGGRLTSGGRALRPNDLSPGTNGLVLEVDFDSDPEEEHVLVPLPICLGGCPELGADHAVQLVLQGLPETVRAVVLDDEGLDVARGHGGVQTVLSFVPRGGVGYQLMLLAPPGTGQGNVTFSSQSGTAITAPPRNVCSGVPQGTPCRAAAGGVGVCSQGTCAVSRCGDGLVDVNAGEACDDGNDVPADGCEPTTCQPSCTTSTQCQDANTCNGEETCTLGRCVPGTAAVDNSTCTLASGGPGLCRGGACANTTCGNAMPDAGEDCDDGNLVNTDGCTNTCTFTCTANAGCDDGNVCNGRETCVLATHTCAPGVTLVCNDQNPCTADRCDPARGCQAPLVDVDGDGHAPTALGTCGDDCDDAQPTVFAGAPELCDALDNDCDLTPDDGINITCYADDDGDGFGERGQTLMACACPAGFVPGPPTRELDCLDGAAVGSPQSDVFPGQSASFVAGYCPNGGTCAAGGMSWDYNCDNADTPRWPNLMGACVLFRGVCTGSGWAGAVPACGGGGRFHTCALDRGGNCVGTDATRPQECR